jgi:hypothetical protein
MKREAKKILVAAVVAQVRPVPSNWKNSSRFL